MKIYLGDLNVKRRKKNNSATNTFTGGPSKRNPTTKNSHSQSYKISSLRVINHFVAHKSHYNHIIVYELVECLASAFQYAE